MIEQNLAQILNVITLIPMASVLATANGTGVDITDYVGELKLVLACKNTAGTTPTLDITIEESDVSGSGYTAVTGGAFTQVTDAGTSAAVVLTLNLNAPSLKKYIRAVKTIGGTARRRS
jgi:hypothetical protein